MIGWGGGGGSGGGSSSDDAEAEGGDAACGGGGGEREGGGGRREVEWEGWVGDVVSGWREHVEGDRGLARTYGATVAAVAGGLAGVGARARDEAETIRGREARLAARLAGDAGALGRVGEAYEKLAAASQRCEEDCCS